MRAVTHYSPSSSSNWLCSSSRPPVSDSLRFWKKSSSSILYSPAGAGTSESPTGRAKPSNNAAAAVFSSKSVDFDAATVAPTAGVELDPPGTVAADDSEVPRFFCGMGHGHGLVFEKG